MRLLLCPLSVSLVLASLMMATGGPAQAALFSDDEARQAILDLRTRQTQTDQLLRTQMALVADQIQQLQRSLLDLNSQNEQLRGDLAKLRGQNEQLLRDLAEVQRRQRDVAQGVEDRIRKLEPQSVTVDGATFSVEPEEKRAYEESMAAFRAGDYDKAINAFSTLLRRYPGTGYQDSTRFWLGSAQYVKQNYKDAITTLRAFLAAAPEHQRAPEALLSIGNCQAESKDNKAAKRTLEDLIKQFPKSEAAQAAKERLLALK